MDTSFNAAQYTSNLIGRAEKDFAPTPITGDKVEMDKHAFFRLLTTQLAHQDPLNPLDDKEFVAQLAQFSSLEQLNNIADVLGDIKEKFSHQEVLNAVNFIGKEILAEGNSISKNGESVSSLSYNLSDVAANLYMNIMDSHGNIVRSITLPGRMPGEHQFTWDGKDHNGSSLPDGVYNIFMAAEGENGEPLMVSTKTDGVVSGVVNEDGKVLLRLEDGRKVYLQDVKEVVGASPDMNLNALASQIQSLNNLTPGSQFPEPGATESLLNSLGLQ